MSAGNRFFFRKVREIALVLTLLFRNSALGYTISSNLTLTFQIISHESSSSVNYQKKQHLKLHYYAIKL